MLRNIFIVWELSLKGLDEGRDPTEIPVEQFRRMVSHY